MHQWTAQLEASETERKQMEEALAKGAFSIFPKKFGGLPRSSISPSKSDLPPEKESSFMLDWKLRKGAIDGQKVLHTTASY